ncbi:MAG: hypothetical protein R2839_10965 [Thermomicrobiales bacterium]
MLDVTPDGPARSFAAAFGQTTDIAAELLTDWTQTRFGVRRVTGADAIDANPARTGVETRATVFGITG